MPPERDCMAEKRGRVMSQYRPPEPLPEVTPATPPIVQDMIRLLLANQDIIAARDFQNLAFYLEKGEQVCMKMTRRLSI
jgi:hypothetical protein